MLCPLAMPFKRHLSGRWGKKRKKMKGKKKDLRVSLFQPAFLTNSFTVFDPLPCFSHILANSLLLGTWEVFRDVCVPAFCIYVCVTPYALQIQECVWKWCLLPPFHSDNICHQLQHTPCLPRLPRSPSFLPSFPPSSSPDKGSLVTRHLKGRLRLGKHSSYILIDSN